MTETAVLICGHGSRDPEAITEFELLAAGAARAAARRRFRYRLSRIRPSDDPRCTRSTGVRAVRAGSSPSPGCCSRRAMSRTTCLGRSTAYAPTIPSIEVRLGRDLAIDPNLLRAAADRIAAAAALNGVDRSESLLLVVGRGTNDPDANSNIAKVARMLWEGMGFGWAETAYSGVAHPRVDQALTRAARLGFRRIVVFPYFLFTGVLVKRIYAQTEAVAQRFPDIEFVDAPYLRDHPAVLDAFCERVAELHEAQPAMNCQLCKYRTQIIGYETRCRRGAGRPSSSCPRHRRRRSDGHGHSHSHPHRHGHDHHHR